MARNKNCTGKKKDIKPKAEPQGGRKRIYKAILIKRMKKTFIITTFILATVVAMISCGGGPRRDTGKIYMPDMAYSRAYETFALNDSSLFYNNSNNPSSWGHKIFYNSQPVTGTMRRGEMDPYTIPNDSNGLLNLSNMVVNPLPPLSKPDSLEAGRLFNIYCAASLSPRSSAAILRRITYPCASGSGRCGRSSRRCATAWRPCTPTGSSMSSGRHSRCTSRWSGPRRGWPGGCRTR